MLKSSTGHHQVVETTERRLVFLPLAQHANFPGSGLDVSNLSPEERNPIRQVVYGPSSWLPFRSAIKLSPSMSFTFAVKWSFTQLAVEGLTVVLTFVFSSFFQVQTVVQIVGIPKPQIIKEFVQVQTKSVDTPVSQVQRSLSECSSAFLRSASRSASLTGRERPIQ